MYQKTTRKKSAIVFLFLLHREEGREERKGGRERRKERECAIGREWVHDCCYGDKVIYNVPQICSSTLTL